MNDKGRPRRITAEELVTQLQQDPAFVAESERRERLRAERAGENRRAARACVDGRSGRPGESFLYEYDFTGSWRPQMERILPMEPRRRYCVCSPPEPPERA
jgi:hypothetical protein